MKAPMILPWLARRWNVTESRALELWNRACQEADAALGPAPSSRYWALAKSRLIDLLDSEVMARVPVCDTPWVMMYLNVLRLVAEFRFWRCSRARSFRLA